jgi:hypothetical protein
MGKSERREPDRRLEVLLQHLLNWREQPKRRGNRGAARPRFSGLTLRSCLRKCPA